MDPAEIRADTARRLHKRGGDIIPLPARRKAPPPTGWRDRQRATLGQVLSWCAGCNLGLRTGQPSGVVVVDLDPGSELDVEGVETWTSITGRGRQMFFAMPEGIDLGNSAGKLAKATDVRATGGYVVLPGSIHPSGAVYTWAEGLGPGEVPLADLPAAWLARLLPPPPPTGAPPRVNGGDGSRQRAYAVAGLAGLADDVRTAPEGARNQTLCRATWKALGFVRAGSLTQAEVEATMTEAGLAAGLQASEVRATVRSALHPQREPEARTPPEREHRQGRPAPLREAPTPGDEDAPHGVEVDPRDTRPSYERLLHPLDLTTEPEPVPHVVAGIIPVRGRTLIAAQSGRKKSMLAASLGLSVATGLDWLGQERFRVANNEGPVVLVEEEASPGALHLRLCRLAQGIGVDAGDLQRSERLIAYAQQGIAIGSDRWAALLDLVRAQKPTLVVLDPAVRVMLGDENEAQAVATFWACLGEIQREGTAVVVVHHAGWTATSRPRGSSDWRGGCDVELSLEETETDPDLMRVITGKVRDGERPGPFLVRFDFSAGYTLAWEGWDDSGPKRRSKRDAAAAALEQMRQDFPELPPAEMVKRVGAAKNIGQATVWRAWKELGE